MVCIKNDKKIKPITKEFIDKQRKKTAKFIKTLEDHQKRDLSKGSQIKY